MNIRINNYKYIDGYWENGLIILVNILRYIYIYTLLGTCMNVDALKPCTSGEAGNSWSMDFHPLKIQCVYWFHDLHWYGSTPTV